MKIKLLSILLFAALVSCSETKDETENTEGTNKDMVDESDASNQNVSSSIDLISSIVTKGGEKAADQVQIEAMMESLKAEKEVEGWESKVVGHWVGDFGKNKINITITSIEEGKVEGFSVCAGNFRKIVGTVVAQGAGYHFTMAEPGTDKYDGTFDFEVSHNFSDLSGTWEPFQKEGNSAKKYSLLKQDFTYDVNVGDYPDASQKLLSYEDVENLNSEELGYMRNEIYARHGYSFKNKEYRYIFEKKDWYMPMGLDIRHQLTEIEIENIGLIYEYETYFDEYYDEYGR